MNTYSITAEIIVRASSEDEAMELVEGLEYPSIESFSVDTIEEIPAPMCPHCDTTTPHAGDCPAYNYRNK